VPEKSTFYGWCFKNKGRYIFKCWNWVLVCPPYQNFWLRACPYPGWWWPWQLKKRQSRLGDNNVYDMNLINSRVLGWQQTRDIDIKTVLTHELSPVPTSMFDDEDKMRIATTKSTLKTKRQVTFSQRLVEKSEVEILDGCAILWIINWPNQGTVADFVNGFTRNVMRRVASQDTYLIFDRYFDFSIKSGTWQLELVAKRVEDTDCIYIPHCHPRKLSLQ